MAGRHPCSARFLLRDEKPRRRVLCSPHRFVRCAGLTTSYVQAARASAAQRREFTTADFRQLFSYCRHGKYRQAKDLLRAGCPVDGRDQFGNTPLIIACQNGHARLVKALLRHGAVIDAANKSGNTGLHYAVSFGFSPLADFLISQGADDKVRNAVGLTPYEGIK